MEITEYYFRENRVISSAWYRNGYGALMCDPETNTLYCHKNDGHLICLFRLKSLKTI
jgi:hypothetical protein